jgi:serine protease Do
VKIWRSGKEKKLTVIVGELQSATAVASVDRTPPPTNKPKSTAFSWLGLSVAELPQEIAQKLSIDGGVVISSSEGVSRGAGLLTGDVITSVNNKNVISVSQFRTAISNSKKGKVLVFLVRRGAEAMFVPVRP